MIGFLRVLWDTVRHPREAWADLRESYRFGYEMGTRYGFRDGKKLVDARNRRRQQLEEE